MPTLTATDRMLDELHTEAALTRRVLERIPEEQLSWKPHWKSLSLGQLALHIAVLPWGLPDLLTELIVEAPEVPYPQPATRDEVLETFDRSIGFATNKLTGWGDEGLEAEWKLIVGGQVVAAQPRAEVLRTLLFNQLVHHRGQLTVYLRLLDVPLPPIYGPSADESPFG